MFIAREEELTRIRTQISSNRKSAILVYGKRRIGKTCLISEALSGFDGCVIEHTCARTTYQGNLSLLSRSICDVLELPRVEFADFMDLFDFMVAQTKGRQVVLVIDEYQYFKQSGTVNQIDSLMQIIIDKMPSNINIILCGSCISVMRELLEEENPLFGRFTETIHLQAFDYYDSSLFWEDASKFEKVERYAILGGLPYALEMYDSSLSIEDNIKKYILPETGLLRSYVENVILKEIQKAYDIRIFEVIGNGKKKYSEIASSLGGDNGLLDKQLKNLISMDAVSKVFPINKPNDKKKQFYVINDNLVRFYFTYVFGRGSLIAKLGIDQYYELYVESSLNEFISRRFEDIAAQYFIRRIQKGELKGVYDVGSYWYDDPKSRTNGEYDVVLKRADGYDFYECKYYSDAMCKKECDAEAAQVEAIREIECRKIGFIAMAGFDFKSDRFELIEGDKLFAIQL